MVVVEAPGDFLYSLRHHGNREGAGTRTGVMYGEQTGGDPGQPSSDGNPERGGPLW
jgi:hypothetical protein